MFQATLTTLPSTLKTPPITEPTVLSTAAKAPPAPLPEAMPSMNLATALPAFASIGVSFSTIGTNSAPIDVMTLSLVRFQVADRDRSEEHTSELQSRGHLVCRLLLE